MNVTPPTRVDPDAALVESLRNDEPGAVEALVNTFGDRVYRLAIRITGSNEDAEEIVQDALWTAARKIHMFKGDSAFGSWLYRVTANAAYQKLRTRKGRAAEIPWDDTQRPSEGDGRFFEPVDDWSRRVDEQALQAELRTVLQGAIDALPPDYRTAFVMHDMEGMSNPEIAEAVGISLPAVKSRVHRSRLFLRGRLEQYMATDRERSSA
jgi:RNA polymerase sigma-70 factor (ECF subfamily)